MDRAESLKQTATTLIRARRAAAPIENLKDAETPTDLREVYAIQDAIAADFGQIGGFKVGAPSPTDEPFFAPMPKAWMVANNASLAGEHYRLCGVEAEIAFEFGRDLAPRKDPYTREEVAAAVSQCVPAIELLESAYSDPRAVPRFTMFADLQMHGGFVPGAAIANWQSIDWSKEAVELLVDGKVEVARTGSNPGGSDLLRLLTYLANEGAERTGGIRAGQWVTTGSWTGATWLQPGRTVEARFASAGSAFVRFA